MTNCSFIVNPVSGKGKKARIVAAIREAFPESEILYTKYPGHASVLASRAESDTVIAVGGDGTVNETARGLVGSTKALGIIPCGSGDGLALHIGMSRNISKAISQLKGAQTRLMDCGVVNGRHFFCTAGVGFDAKVGLDFASAKGRGLFNYVKVSARDWFGYHPDHYKVRVDGADAWEGDAVFVTVGNAGQWGNNARICGNASVFDGQLDVTVVKPFHTAMFPALLVRLMSGKVSGSSKTLCLRGQSVEIVRSAEGPAHFDGEAYMEGKHLEISILPSSIYVLIPR